MALAHHQRRSLRLLLRQAHTLVGAASGHLIARPESLTSSLQLGKEELESLAFILGTKEEICHSFARQGHDQTFVAKLFSGLDPGLKRVLVQKLVAASGVQATPLLLAWTSEELRLFVSKQAADANASVSAQPWYHELVSLASTWVARQSGPASSQAPLTELQCLQSMAQAPGAIRWDDLLALPSLHLLLDQAAQANPLLSDSLQHLGLRALAASTEGIAAEHNPSAAGNTTPTTPTPNDVSKPDTASSPSRTTTFTHAAAALDLQAKQFLMTELKQDASGSPAASLVTLITQSKVQPVPSSQAVAVLVLRLVQYLRAALGQSPGAAASTLLNLLRCPVQQPQLELQPASVQAAAAEVWVHATAKQTPLAQLYQLPHAELEQLLQQMVLEKPNGAVAKLLAPVQAERVSQLLRGEPIGLSTASSSVLSELPPEQFWQLNTLASRCAAAGEQLVQQLFGDSSPTGLGVPQDDQLLSTIWGLQDEDRRALAWALLRTGGTVGRGGEGVLDEARGRLLRAFAGRAVGVVGRVTAGVRAAEELAMAVAEEQRMAGLDVVGGRHESPMPSLTFTTPQDSAQNPSTTSSSAGPALPTMKQLKAARESLPESQLLLMDLLLQDSQTEGSASDPSHLHAVFHSLLTSQSSTVPASALIDTPIPSSGSPFLVTPALSDWAADSKRQLVGLSPSALSLMSRFLKLRVARDKETVVEGQRQLTWLLQEVQSLLTPGHHHPSSSPSSPSTQPISPFWLSPDTGSSKGGSPGPPREGGAAGDLPSPEVVRSLLGAAEGAQFEAWMKASALATAADDWQPYEALDDVHLEQDLERYLTMEHDPQLHLVMDAAPRPWTEHTPGSTPTEFLDTMRQGLDRYLSARGLRPILDAEWVVYSEAALTEFNSQRAQHERALRNQGRSVMFNAKAESAYLHGLLRAGIAPDAPLYAQAGKYLAVLDANNTWTFTQKKRVVQRLIELSSHFAAHPPPSERGSPFAPLFKSKDPAPLIPSLKPWTEARASAAAKTN